MRYSLFATTDVLLQNWHDDATAESISTSCIDECGIKPLLAISRIVRELSASESLSLLLQLELFDMLASL
jgi:hypothetical protein